PGKSAESRLIRFVAGSDQKFMPPMGAHLTADEVGLLRAWIDQGVEWTARAPHWSFQKIQRPAPPRPRSAIAPGAATRWTASSSRAWSGKASRPRRKLPS